MSIPKIIHYCWFGHNPLPEDAKRCIESWKKYCPDFEIKEWNEDNFDINICDYVKEAYDSKKWAFVSDYARFWILYTFGGLYFDTDVEMIKSFEKIIQLGSFMGCEAPNPCSNFKRKNIDSRFGLAANPGLGLAAAPGLGIYKEILDKYSRRHFFKENGGIDETTVVAQTTSVLLEHGWIPGYQIQNIEGITIYPPEYFCPLNYYTGELEITSNTYSIHHYSATWVNPMENKLDNMLRLYRKNTGIKRIFFYIASIPIRCIVEINKNGFKAFFKR